MKKELGGFMHKKSGKHILKETGRDVPLKPCLMIVDVGSRNK